MSLPFPATSPYPLSRSHRPPRRPLSFCRAVSNDIGPVISAGSELNFEVFGKHRRHTVMPSVGKRGFDVLCDDGFGSASVKDFFEGARQFKSTDGGPPRWFSPVECGRPVVDDAPLLLFLPDIDGVGMGMVLHHKSLGKIFEVRCLHIPANDRTSFQGLVELIEHSVKNQHMVSPNKPIYLLGDSLGSCLALAVAVRNPTIDLVLVLVNPATSFDKSLLKPLLSLMEAVPSYLLASLPELLPSIFGDPIKMAMASFKVDLTPIKKLEELGNGVASVLLPFLSDIVDILPMDTFLWRLELLQHAASYVNSRLHAVEAEVLVLASDKDSLLPSRDEANRLFSSLKNCKVRHFKESGHSLLLENGINLAFAIKCTRTYRLSRHHDYSRDYIPPTLSEFRDMCDKTSWFWYAISPVMLSTLNDGSIVKGLSGIPDKGPVLFVANHMLMGLELSSLYVEFLKEKKSIIRGMAHPILFSRKNETSSLEINHFDNMIAFGGLPVTPANMYKMFSTGSFVLLYPGGTREALHRKGEEYKLFWPDQPEFVRMAARFGATIVPFGVVGEDDIAQLVLDYNDIKDISFMKNWLEENNEGFRLRAGFTGEVANQDLHVPLILPKLPGRFYYLFGKPFETKGTDILSNRDSANSAYLCIKSDIESSLSYLKMKREEDPYRSLLQRILYLSSRGFSADIPAFEL